MWKLLKDEIIEPVDQASAPYQAPSAHHRRSADLKKNIQTIPANKFVATMHSYRTCSVWIWDVFSDSYKANIISFMHIIPVPPQSTL